MGAEDLHRKAEPLIKRDGAALDVKGPLVLYADGVGKVDLLVVGLPHVLVKEITHTHGVFASVRDGCELTIW
jgi:hypothetical protein